MNEQPDQLGLQIELHILDLANEDGMALSQLLIESQDFLPYDSQEASIKIVRKSIERWLRLGWITLEFCDQKDGDRSWRPIEQSQYARVLNDPKNWEIPEQWKGTSVVVVTTDRGYCAVAGPPID